MTKLAAALAFLGLNFYIYHFFATQAVYPPRTSLEEFPLQLEGGWVCPDPQRMGAGVEKNLGVTDYLLCDFRNPEQHRMVNVYLGYHRSQVREEGGGSGENSIHPPAHCLPGSGWDIIRDEKVPLEVEGFLRPGATVNRMLIAKGEMRQLVYYWYQSRGRVISEDWEKILFVGLDRALRQRTDGSLVRFTMPIFHGSEAEAEASFRSLAPRILTRLPQYVPN